MTNFKLKSLTTSQVIKPSKEWWRKITTIKIESALMEEDLCLMWGLIKAEMITMQLLIGCRDYSEETRSSLPHFLLQ